MAARIEPNIISELAATDPRIGLGRDLSILGACCNSISGVFGIFLAKKSFQSSKFSEGIFFYMASF
jgi:hypothetical protein